MDIRKYFADILTASVIQDVWTDFVRLFNEVILIAMTMSSTYYDFTLEVYCSIIQLKKKRAD